MWLAKPVYEAVPYIYCVLGVLFMLASWFRATGLRSFLLLLTGAGLLLIGLVLWLRRRDFRDAQRVYSRRSLDD